MRQQRAERGRGRGRGKGLPPRFGRGEAGRGEADGGALDIALAAGDLSGKADIRLGFEPQRAVEELGTADEAVTVNAAQPSELGILERRDSAEDADLLAMLELGLEADDIPQGRADIVLAQLNHRIGPAAGLRIVQPDAFERPVAQGLGPALGHHLDRHAALEIGRVLFPFLERHFFAGVKRLDEGVILLAGHRAVDVIIATLVPARGLPGDVHVDAVAVNDRRDGIEKGERVAPRLSGDAFRQRGPGQRTGGDDRGVVGEGIDPLTHDRDVRVCRDRVGYARGKDAAIDCQSRAGRHARAIGLAQDERAHPPHLLMEQPDRIILRIVGPKAVRADHLRQRVAFVRGSHVAAAPHLAQADPQACFGQLPGGLGPGEPAADDVNVMHGRAVAQASRGSSPGGPRRARRWPSPRRHAFLKP